MRGEAPRSTVRDASFPDAAREDLRVLRTGQRLAICIAPGGVSTSRATHITKYCVPASENDADLDAHARKKNGAGDVVDGRLRVYGIKGLRVCDASVLPNIPAAHLMAAVIAVAERRADMIKEDNA
ncbi:Alcohol oxidase [Mycena kentingensis (nom. inval.)]|nr:Alcohol oxidase [Mycena kentingensis (nom. inval.)]